jgi:hypothetical protein
MIRMKDIYLLYECDDWKSHSSMSLRMATTSEKKIRKAILEAIGDKDMELDVSNKATFLRERDLHEIDNNLKYGFINIVGDGEEQ